jgi:sterol desaturase/sphingolipid hydroxylase (fatty acid hydroxylase superfamily)
LIFSWELFRFALQWRRPWDTRDVRLDVAMEGFFGVISAICSILAAFQTAQHRAHNARNDVLKYQDVWLEMGLAIMLGFLT